MIVDTHVHVWAEDSEQYPHHRPTPPPAMPIELLLAKMDEAKVTHAVLVQPTLYGADNRYLADCVQRNPRRFAGVGIVDIRSSDATSKLSYWVKERGIRGVRLLPILDPQGDLLLQSTARLVWEQSRNLGITVSVLLAPRHFPQLKALIEECPDTKVVIEHLGRPDVVEQPLAEAIQPLLDFAIYPNVYVKVSPISYFSKEKKYPFADTFQMILAVLERFGSKHLLWASDFPAVLSRCGYPEELAIVRDLIPFFNKEDRDWILSGTAHTLWEFT